MSLVVRAARSPSGVPCALPCDVFVDPGASCARLLRSWEAGYEAEPGTIRGDLSASRGYNLVHGSDSTVSAQAEIKLFFLPDEIIDYELTDAPWLYGRND